MYFFSWIKSVLNVKMSKRMWPLMSKFYTKNECTKFRGSSLIFGLMGLVPPWDQNFFSWEFCGSQIFFSWGFCGSQIFSRGYFVGPKRYGSQQTSVKNKPKWNIRLRAFNQEFEVNSSYDLVTNCLYKTHTKDYDLTD